MMTMVVVVVGRPFFRGGNQVDRKINAEMIAEVRTESHFEARITL